MCISSSGLDATNLVTAIADSKLDSILLICVTGQIPSFMIGTDAFQEVYTNGISIPMTKHTGIWQTSIIQAELDPSVETCRCDYLFCFAVATFLLVMADEKI